MEIDNWAVRSVSVTFPESAKTKMPDLEKEMEKKAIGCEITGAFASIVMTCAYTKKKRRKANKQTPWGYDSYWKVGESLVLGI